jgi:hypothetical protein
MIVACPSSLPKSLLRKSQARFPPKDSRGGGDSKKEHLNGEHNARS